MRLFTRGAVVILLALALGSGAFAQTAPVLNSVPTWDAGVIELFESLAVQDGGRVKPMDTYAQFTMLKLNGKRWFTTSGGEKLYPVAWLLNCLLFPEVANDYQHFIVDTSEVIVALGLPTHDKKRSHYSYNELAAGRSVLFEKGMQYSQIDAAERTRIQSHIVNLTHNFMQYESLIGFFDFARKKYVPMQGSALEVVMKEEGGVSTSRALASLPVVIAALQTQRGSMDEAMLTLQIEALEKLSRELEVGLRFSNALSLLPPADTEVMEWFSPQTAGYDGPARGLDCDDGAFGGYVGAS
jgi:hypothetical protein